MSATPPSTNPPERRLIEDVACPACGYMCDDISLEIAGERVVRAQRACPRGEQWFLTERPRGMPPCTVRGKPASLDAALDAAAELLVAARYPLVYGLSETTSETQRAAVSLADWLGAVLDTPSSALHGPTGLAFHGVGEVTCSLGEVKNRGDLVIFWNADPAASHPRHFEKFSLNAAGMFVPRGRADRTGVVVSPHRTPSADSADMFIPLKADADFEALWTLRALIAGLPVDPRRTLEDTGVELTVWQDLTARMKRARFGVIFFGHELAASRGRRLNIEAALALTRDLNTFTRFVCNPLHGPHNLPGSDNVLTWTTGFPFAVSLAAGYPRYSPGEFSAEAALARGEIDAALVVACDPASALSESALERLRNIPMIVIAAEPNAALTRATVAVRTAVTGLHVSGTVYRMDEVPIPLRPATVSPLARDADVLAALESRVRVRQTQAHGSKRGPNHGV